MNRASSRAVDVRLIIATDAKGVVWDGVLDTWADANEAMKRIEETGEIDAPVRSYSSGVEAQRFARGTTGKACMLAKHPDKPGLLRKDVRFEVKP